MPPDPDPNRRDFLNAALGAWAACACGAAAAALGASATPLAEPPATARVPRASFEDGVALASVGGRPVAVVAGPAGSYALSLACTHARCTVRWDRGARQFLCPCHGGRFDAEGRVVAGPPPAPLRRLEIREDGDAFEVKG
jgi:cytochrome b6-f complex iron-sulfur subunit